MAGNLALLLNGIGLAVTFTILLVVANTMSMAVRERRKEIGVLKTLGFTSGQVMGLVVAESLLIGAHRRRARRRRQPAASCGSSPTRPASRTRSPGIGLSELHAAPAGGGARLRESRSSSASPPASCPRSPPTARASPTC